ncbi:MAG: Rab family GTPase [Candidatus Heimdallarchaeota archaeon]
MKFLPRKSKKPLKLVILGEGGVGKTTLSKSFTSSSFSPDTKQTIAVEFHSKLMYDRRSRQHKLQIWDFGGQEQFKNMGVFREFCIGADAAILCFDLTDLSTLFSLPEWLEFIDPKVPRFLIGTKLDLATPEERNFELTPFHRQFQCFTSFKCSARDAQLVFEIFGAIIDFIDSFKKGTLDPTTNLPVNVSKQTDNVLRSLGDSIAKVITK